MWRASALTRRGLADSRVRNLSYCALFALVAYANVAGYRATYPTLKDRLGFAHSFGGDASLRLFYGHPFDLLSVGGYSAWRVGGVLAIIAGLWGALAAVKALRGEEDSGRTELVLAGAVRRSEAYLSAVAGALAGALALWLALFAGLLAGPLPASGSAYLALAIVSVACVFVGVGAVCSQLASSRRVALEIAGGALAVSLVVRVVADTDAGLEWLRWCTPLGWAEEMRAFTGSRAGVLVLPVLATSGLLAAAGAIARRRDVGSGLIASRDRSAPRMRGLSSPTALALRGERASLTAWLLGVGFFALIIGLVSKSVSAASIPASLRREFAKLGGASITTPSGYIGLTFLFFVLVVSAFCCAQIAAARREEAEGRLETLFALPAARRGWLRGRLVLGVAGALVLGLDAGLLAWLGAAVQNAHLSLASAVEAGANCVPVATLFLGLAALGFALLPRAGAGIGYGLLAAAFVWQLFGSLVGAPRWLLELSPFEHVGLVPAQRLHTSAALVMLACGAAACAVAVWAFAQRDLAGE